MISIDQEFDIETLSPKELILNNIETMRTENVPIDKILMEESLIDTFHRDDLKKSILVKRGQISPITVRARLLDTDIVYDITDGFHRVHALNVIQQDTGVPMLAKAVVIYGCDDEEMYDLRVLAVNSAATIKFARMSEWMQLSFTNAAWENAEIAEAIENGAISLYQAFSITNQNTNARSFGLSSQAVAELKAWVNGKASYWGKSVGSLTTELKVIDDSAPDIVKQVRKITGGSKDGTSPLTFARLKAITEGIPKDIDLQRKVVDIVTNHNITAADIPLLVDAVKLAKNSANGNAQEAEARVKQVLDHHKLYISRTDKKTTRTRRNSGPKPEIDEDQGEPLEMDVSQRVSVLQAIIDSVLNETEDNDIDDEALKTRIYERLSMLRQWLGLDEAEAKANKGHEVLYTLADVEQEFFLVDKAGNQIVFNLSQKTLLTADGRVVTLLFKEAVLLALKLVYKKELTQKMIRAELFGPEKEDNEYLDKVIVVINHQLRSKLALIGA